MIKNAQPISMAEASKYLDKKEESSAKALEHIKSFSKLNPKKADEMKNALKELGLIKMNDHQIAQVMDFMPKGSEEINKIFTDVSLDEDERNKIIEIVKQFE